MKETRMLAGLKTVLEKEGFRTSWADPRFHEVAGGGPCSQPVHGDTLYVLDLPILRVVPFDSCNVSLRIQEDRLLFELVFLYQKELEPLVDAEPICEYFERHAAQWAPKLAAFLQVPSEKYSLRLDTEYDDHIEDSLYGWIAPSETAVLSLLREIIACTG